jgi:hypothetical protein
MNDFEFLRYVQLTIFTAFIISYVALVAIIVIDRIKEKNK